jgi:hypothetical protein
MAIDSKKWLLKIGQGLLALIAFPISLAVLALIVLVLATPFILLLSAHAPGPFNTKFGILVACVAALAFLVAAIVEKDFPPFRGTPGVLAFIGAYVAFYYVVIGFVYAFSGTAISHTWLQVVMVVSICVGGIVLAFAKRNFLLQYSLLEMSFALISTWYSIEQVAKTVPPQGTSASVSEQILIRVSVLGGSLYLMSRGVANFLDAKQKLA